MLAERIRLGLWGKTLAGDLLDDTGAVTGPLWGRGRLTSTEEALALETSIAQQHADLCDGMEHAGLNQERRALSAKPDGMRWEWHDNDDGTVDLTLTFSLAAGYYATSLIRELMQVDEPERRSFDEPSPDSAES